MLGIVLASLAPPAAAFEIGHTSVTSKLGEPLDATVRIFPAPGETIDPTCLALVDEQDHAESGDVLIRDAAFSQQSGSSAIRITTSTPITQSAIALALRANCGNGPAVVRTINLYLSPALSPTPQATNPALPGSSFTVKPGDSIHKLARLIYPHDQTAMRNLARAIVLANPASFPDGRARPLQIGEHLIIPDLRTVDRIITAPRRPNVRSGQHGRAQAATAGETATVSTAGDGGQGVQLQQAGKARHTGKAPGSTAASSSRPGFKVVTSGKVERKLSTDRDLSSAPAQSGKTVRPPPTAAAAPTTAVNGKTPLQRSTTASRIDRLLALQDQLNRRLARLETNATVLQKTLAHKQAMQNAGPPSVTRPAASQTTSPTPAAPAAMTNRMFNALQSNWLVIGGLVVVALIVGWMLARAFRNQRSMSQHRKRIDAMLEEARSAATPLLDSEPRLPARDHPPAIVAAQTTGEADRAHNRAPDATSGHGLADEVPAWLGREMDTALDSARSMFSDVDRFITLGRTEKAINLLEFQIKRNPADRNAWLKLMALYRDGGLDDHFSRTYSAFREQFG